MVSLDHQVERQLRELGLRKKEWQRWVPALGFVRLLKDIITQDSDLLATMYSAKYNVANIAYNVASTMMLIREFTYTSQ